MAEEFGLGAAPQREICCRLPYVDTRTSKLICTPRYFQLEAKKRIVGITNGGWLVLKFDGHRGFQTI